MIAGAKFNFKTETLPSKGGLDRRAVIGAAVFVLALGAFFYVRYLTNLTHHRVMTAASRAVVAGITSGAASTVAATKATSLTATPKTVATASKTEAQPALAAVAVNNNPSNSVPAKAAPVSLGDSLMAVLSPSAKAETIQAPLLPEPVTSAPATVPVARQPLTVQAFAPRAVNHAPPLLTDAQKLALVAQARLGSFIEMAVKNPDVFGFNSGEQVGNATLGEPIAVFTISDTDRKKYQTGQPLKPLLQATNEWIFPVVLDGSIRYMLPVRHVGDAYVPGPGSRALAIVYEKIQQRWPASEGYHPQLVVNPNISNYFFTVPELPEQNLTDTGDMFQYNSNPSPASVILASWQ